MRISLYALLLLGLTPMQPASAAPASTIESLVPEGSKPAVIADGLKWTEGPVWIADGAYLLFSDVPNNRIYRWSDGSKAAVFKLVYPISAGSGKTLTSSVSGSTRTMALSPLSVIQGAPSGPTITPCGEDPDPNGI